MKKIVRLTESDLVRLVKKVIKENEESDGDRFVKITNELFPYKSLGLEHYEIFNKEDEDELEFQLESGSLSKNDITDYLEYFFKEKFPNFEVHCGFYYGDKDIYINLGNDDETFGINLEYDLPSYNPDKYF